MGKALLQRASESVLHAEKRRLLWGAKPFKAIDYSSSVSCSPVIPGRYRNPSLPDIRYLFVANRSDFYSGCCTDIYLRFERYSPPAGTTARDRTRRQGRP